MLSSKEVKIIDYDEVFVSTAPIAGTHLAHSFANIDVAFEFIKKIVLIYNIELTRLMPFIS